MTKQSSECDIPNDKNFPANYQRFIFEHILLITAFLLYNAAPTSSYTRCYLPVNKTPYFIAFHAKLLFIMHSIGQLNNCCQLSLSTAKSARVYSFSRSNTELSIAPITPASRSCICRPNALEHVVPSTARVCVSPTSRAR